MALTDEDEETLGKILASLERGASYDSRDARASAAALPRFGAVDASGDGSSSSSASVRRRSSLRSQNSLDSVTSALEKLVAGFESESQGTLSESFTKALQNTEAVVGLREELQSSEEALQEAKAQSEALASVQLEAERLEELATERQAERQVLKHELAALQEALKSSEDAVHLRDLKHAEVLQRSETVEAGLREALHQSEQALALAEQRNVQPMSPMSPDSTGTWRVASGVGKKNKMTTPRPDDGDVLETRETREVLRTLEALRTEEAKSEMLAKEKQCLQEELRTSEKAFCEKESNCMQISRHLEVLDASLKEAQQRTEDADKRLAAEQASFEEKLSLLQEELRSSEDALCEEASHRAQIVKSSEDLEARLKETLERKDEGNNEQDAEQSQALHASLQEALQRTEDSDKRLVAEQTSFEEKLGLLQEELRSSKEAICSEESKQAQAVEHSEALDARLKEALQRQEDAEKSLAVERQAFVWQELRLLQEELRSAEEALRQEESKRAQVDKSSEDSEASAKETLERTDEGNNKRDGEWSELETLHTSLQEALQRTEDADKRLVAEQTSFEEKLRLLQEELRSSEDALCEEASQRAQVVKSSEDLEARLKETLERKDEGNNERGAEQSQALHASLQEALQRTEDSDKRLAAEQASFEEQLSLLQEELRSSKEAICSEESKQAQAVEHSEALDARLKETLARKDEGNNKRDGESSELETLHTSLQEALQRTEDSDKRLAAEQTSFEEKLSVLQEELRSAEEALRQEESKRAQVDKSSEDSEASAKETLARTDEGNNKRDGEWSELETLHTSLQEALQRTEDADKRLVAEQTSFEEKLRLLQEELRSSEDALCEEASHRAQVVKSSEDLEARLKETLQGKEDAEKSLAVECSAFEEEVSAKWKLQEQLQQEQSLKEQHRLEGLKLSARQEELEKTEEMQSRRGVEREKKISELEATLQAKGERCLQTEQELHESARELQEAAESWQSSRRECSEREAQSEAKAGELWSEMGELRRELKAEQLKWQGEQRAYQDQAERQRHQLSVCEASMQQEMQRREDQVEVSQAQFRQLREQWRSERCSLRGQLRHASEELRESCARLCALQEQLASEEAQLAEMQSKFQHISQTCEAQDQMLSGGLRRALEEQGQAALAYHQKFQAKERQQQEIQSRRQKEWMQLKLVEEQQVKQLKLQLQHSEKACRMREEELEQQEEQRRNFEEEVLQHRLLCDQRMEECEEGLQLEMAQVREQTLIEARRRQEFAAEKQELLNELAVVRSTVEAQQRREEKHQEAWEAQQALHESLISRYEKAFASMKRKFQRDKAHLQARHEKESEESAADWLQLHSLIKPLICDQEAAAQLVTREVAAQTGRVLFQRFCDMKAEMKELQIEELSSQRTVVRESKKLLPGEGIGTGAASFGEKDAGKSRGCCLTYLDLAMPHVQVGDPSNSAQSSLLSRQCES